jgi:hypothetical protein
MRDVAAESAIFDWTVPLHAQIDDEQIRGRTGGPSDACSHSAPPLAHLALRTDGPHSEVLCLRVGSLSTGVGVRIPRVIRL